MKEVLSTEKYKKNISGRDLEWNTFKVDDKKMDQIKNEVRILNEKKESDQAIFVLKMKNKTIN